MLAMTKNPTIEQIKSCTVFDTDSLATSALRTLEFIQGDGDQFDDLPGTFKFFMGTTYRLTEREIDRSLFQILMRRPRVVNRQITACIFGLIGVHQRDKYPPNFYHDLIRSYKNPDDAVKFSKGRQAHRLFSGIYQTREQAALTFKEYLLTGNCNWY